MFSGNGEKLNIRDLKGIVPERPNLIERKPASLGGPLPNFEDYALPQLASPITDILSSNGIDPSGLRFGMRHGRLVASIFTSGNTIEPETIGLNDLETVQSIQKENGYWNLEINPSYLVFDVLAQIEGLGDSYGHQNLYPGTVLIDYSSPNTLKKMSAANRRSTLIGASLDKIIQATGGESIGINFIGDWGMQFARACMGYELFYDEISEQLWREDPLTAWQQLYSIANDRIKQAKGLEEGVYYDGIVKEWMRKLETGDPEALSLWQSAISLSDQAVERSYKKFGVEFDLTTGESDYVDMAKQLSSILVRSGLAKQRADGSVVVVENHFKDVSPEIANQNVYTIIQSLRELGIVDVTETGLLKIKGKVRNNLPPIDNLSVRELLATLEDANLAEKNENGNYDIEEIVIELINSDGFTTYESRDLASMYARYEWFKPDRMLYVIAANQSHHMQGVIKVFTQMLVELGIEKIPVIDHIAFGLMKNEKGELMSARAGNVIYLEDLLVTIENSIASKIGSSESEGARSHTKGISESEKAALMRKLAISVLNISELGVRMRNDVVFNIEKETDLSGKSGPYYCYQYARARSILEGAANNAGDRKSVV